MGEVNLKWLESVTKEKYGLSQLLSSESRLAVSDGDNYISKVYRLTIQALSSEKQPKQISLILKRKLDLTVENNKDVQDKLDEAFNKEYRVYNELLVKLILYLPKTKDSLWADCISYIHNNDIYFEDLKASGFTLANRLEGVDLDHGLLAFQNLAEFHAASAIALERGELDLSGYTKYLITRTSPDFWKNKSNAFAMMTDVIRKDWGTEWARVADRLTELASIFTEKLQEVVQFDDTRLNVLNHGDPWVNNIMFKYDSNRKPTSVKFVDFQLTHYNSYGFDLCYFLNTSVNYETKKRHLDTWISTYCNTFSTCLDQHGSSLPRLTHDMVRNEITRLAAFSLNVALRIRPMVMVPPEHTVPISDLLVDTGLNSKKRRLYTCRNFTDIMKKDLPDLLDILLK